MTEDFIKIGDQVLNILLEHNGSYVSSNIVEEMNPDYNPQFRLDIHLCFNQLQDRGYVDFSKDGSGWVRILPKGFEAAKSGIKKSLEYQEKRDKMQARREVLELKKLEFYDKVKWLPFIISGASLIISIIAWLQSIR